MLLLSSFSSPHMTHTRDMSNTKHIVLDRLRKSITECLAGAGGGGEKGESEDVDERGGGEEEEQEKEKQQEKEKKTKKKAQASSVAPLDTPLQRGAISAKSFTLGLKSSGELALTPSASAERPVQQEQSVRKPLPQVAGMVWSAGWWLLCCCCCHCSSLTIKHAPPGLSDHSSSQIYLCE
jgi:hypothetical protein